MQLEENSWGDSILSSMDLDEKIAQLMMVTAYPKQGKAHKKQLINLVKTYKPGGILVMQGEAIETAKFINELQAASEVPLLVAIDGETGLGFRLDSTINYPNAQALGAIQNNKLLYQMGRDMAQQFKAMGIQMNFAPVCDINTNPKNPVINFRSFGEDKYNVTRKTLNIAMGLQDEGVIPVIKHYPGHGDTSTDSHYALPVLNHPKERIKNMEMYPFQSLIDSGVTGVMTAHLHVKAFDSTPTPSSLSASIIKNYLADSLGFKGLIITDAMNMKGVAKPGAELEALIAGNDMVEFVLNLKNAISSVKEGVKNKQLSEDEINKKCKKILALKKWCKLDNYAPRDTIGLNNKLNTPAYQVTLRKLVSQSLTILSDSILPIENFDTLKIATVSIGEASLTHFQEMVSNYVQADHYHLPKNASNEELTNLLNKLKPYNLVIGGIYGIKVYPPNKYGVSNTQAKAVAQVALQKKAVFVLFGNVYSLKHFKGIEKAQGLVLAYQDSKLAQKLSAQLLFGAIETEGKLPVHVNTHFPLNFGFPLKKNSILRYGIPEEVGINSRFLTEKVDSIALLGVDSAAYPGCQVLIAKDGNIIFHKCYGYHTYLNEKKVEPKNIYDWASITKITGPLPALMKLVDENKFQLDVPLSNYWPGLKNSNKKYIKVRDVLAHQGKLQAWIPYWHSTLRNSGKLRSRVFKNHPTEKYNLRVSSNLYMNKRFTRNIFEEIKSSPLLKRKKYEYSGLAFYLFPSIIKNLAGENYETYLNSHFFAPLGAHSVMYNPYQKYPLSQIVPTEEDDFFRKELLQGYVHDEGAAMMGGVSGNAGLFGTITDLAKIMQMYLQGGYYGGKRYLSEKTINEFTRLQFPENKNRRGLGFDKPYIDNHKNELEDSYPATDASVKSFGHSGYTGTFTWADPENNLLFIFFSNRVYPTRENSKIYGLNIRTAMHQSIYDSIKRGVK